MEKGPQLEVSIKTLLKPGIEPEIPCLEGQFIPTPQRLLRSYDMSLSTQHDSLPDQVTIVLISISHTFYSFDSFIAE